MLKKHLIILLLLVSSVGLFAQSIPSGTGRYEALGYNPFIMDAATDINRNPAWSGMYRNYVFGDIGRFMPTNNGSSDNFTLSQQYIGVNFNLGKKWNAGLVLNKEEGQIFGGAIRNFYPNIGSGLDVSSAPIVPLKLIVGYTNTSKTLFLGIAPYYAGYSDEYDTSGTGFSVTQTKHSSILGGTIGIVSKMKDSWVEGKVDVKINGFKGERVTTNPSLDTVVTNDGGLELNAFVRGFFMVHKPSKINLVPYVDFGMFNWKPSTSPTQLNPQPEYKYFNIGGGIGLNMPILDNGLLAGGVSVGYLTNEYSTTDTNAVDQKVTTFTLPQFNLGLEWNFTDWLTGRMGYSRAVQSIKTENTRTAYTGSYKYAAATNPEQTITLGLGWHFNRFSLDGLIGEKLFQAGPYLVSGNQTDLYGVLSASYNFNK